MVGNTDGCDNGKAEGIKLGSLVGLLEGSTEGHRVGWYDG